MSELNDAMVEAAAKAMIVEMFAPHELPVDEDIWRQYCQAARHALTAALAILPEAEGWQPIETAPKDGTHIEVCRGPYSEHWTFNQSPPAEKHYCPFCKKSHVGGDTCLGHHP